MIIYVGSFVFPKKILPLPELFVSWSWSIMNQSIGDGIVKKGLQNPNLLLNEQINVLEDIFLTFVCLELLPSVFLSGRAKVGPTVEAAQFILSSVGRE